MDTALLLKMKVDTSEPVTESEIKQMLSGSELVNRLISEFPKKYLYAIWRIIALSEIPFANKLDYTQELVVYINKHLFTEKGFSFTGRVDDLVPCYNAMLIEAYAKLGLSDTLQVQTAVDWIRQYQVFDRQTRTTWQGKGILKYGGCFKSVPCYLGITKTVKALIYYNRSIQSKEVSDCIDQGVSYILSHSLYKRLSNGLPINNHILDLAFPASYQLNIVELLDIVYQTGQINHPNCKEAIDYVMSKRTKDGFWKVDYIYKADGYVSFDRKGTKAEWLSYLFNRFLM